MMVKLNSFFVRSLIDGKHDSIYNIREKNKCSRKTTSLSCRVDKKGEPDHFSDVKTTHTYILYTYTYLL